MFAQLCEIYWTHMHSKARVTNDTKTKKAIFLFNYVFKTNRNRANNL